MKFSLIIAFILLLLNYSNSQVIQNGNFESWLTLQSDEPNNWVTSNNESFRSIGLLTLSKTTDSHSGTAVKLETKTNGTQISFGYFVNTPSDPLSGVGGSPYSQKPQYITGYYKCNLLAGDSAIILVEFKKNGIVFSNNIFKIGGTKTSFTSFSFPLNLSQTPDSVIMGAASSNPFGGTPVPGSYIIFDDLAFTGTSITQKINNGDFESWTIKSNDKLLGFETYGNEGVTKTTDKYRGNYAVQLKTILSGDGSINSAVITNGKLDNGPPTGGAAYSLIADTLEFYYKYIPQGNDTPQFYMGFSKNMVQFEWLSVPISPNSSYTKVEFPFSLMSTPDSVMLFISSSKGNAVKQNVGSILILDEIQFKSSPLNTGIFDLKYQEPIRNYPNPAIEFFNVDFPSKTCGLVSVHVYDISGKEVIYKEFDINAGNNKLIIKTVNLVSGLYIYKIFSEGSLINSGKIIRK